MSAVTTHGGLPEEWSKTQLESLIKGLGRDGLGLTRVAFDLLKHVVRLAAAPDFQPGRVCGNWEKVQDLASALGATPRSIHDAEKLLEARGLIQRTAGRNGYRGVRKCQGLIVRLSGINIGPLIDNTKRLTGLLDTRAFETRATEELKATADALRQKIYQSNDLTAKAQARALLPGGRLSRVKRQHELQALVEALTAIAAQIEEQPWSEISADRSAETAGLITESNSIKSGARARVALDALQPSTAVSFASEDYRILVDALGGPSWPALVEASFRCLPALRIEQSTWGAACTNLGRRQAALCVLAIDRNRKLPASHPHWPAKPGRCLSGMVRKAGIGKLNLVGLLHAASSRPQAPADLLSNLQLETPPMYACLRNALANLHVIDGERMR